jgi:hypothetical protein
MSLSFAITGKCDTDLLGAVFAGVLWRWRFDASRARLPESLERAVVIQIYASNCVEKTF